MKNIRVFFIKRANCGRIEGNSQDLQVVIMIDRDGYRPNVGIVICNSKNQVFWGKRIREHAWQFPQGGIKAGETPQEAMFRELKEETGLDPHHVKILGRTRNWLHYDVPSHWVRREWRGTYKRSKADLVFYFAW